MKRRWTNIGIHARLWDNARNRGVSFAPVKIAVPAIRWVPPQQETMRLSPTVAAIAEPATLLMARRSRELRAQGRDIIDLSLGEPDHDPPAFALEAAHEAIGGPWHTYPR